ncbi:hypothetical protein GCM10009087_00910 [Sphingomonas oligophenolica]|uniref:RNA polymerase sigma factor n=1 Tax=Sphingomonas oligophenolica TaxID=301154 RepID=A0ABU9Y171_9SPHN
MENASFDVRESDLIAAFMAHRAQLARFLRLRCGEDGVEDILHELWLKAQAVDTPIDRPLAYLYRMADRLVLDGRRGAARGRTRDSDWGYIHEQLSETVVQPIAERTLIARERLDAADAVLKSVGDRAARIFRHYRIDGMDQRGIAQELGVSVSTVEKDLRRVYDALLSLRERFDEE